MIFTTFFLVTDTPLLSHRYTPFRENGKMCILFVRKVLMIQKQNLPQLSEVKAQLMTKTQDNHIARSKNVSIECIVLIFDS